MPEEKIVSHNLIALIEVLLKQTQSYSGTRGQRERVNERENLDTNKATIYKEENMASNRRDNDNDNDSDDDDIIEPSERTNINDRFDDEPESVIAGRRDGGDEATAIHDNRSPRATTKPKKKKKKSKKRSARPSRIPSNTDNIIDDDDAPRHKYSTADQPATGRCKKYCMIFLMFLLMVLIMIAISYLMSYFFFGKKSDNDDMTKFVRDENATFPLDKLDIDSACSRGSIDADEGALCKNACMPVYYDCCDPFNEFDIYESYQTVPPSIMNTTEDDDRYIGDLDACDFAGVRGNETNCTKSPSDLNSTFVPTFSPTNATASLLNNTNGTLNSTAMPTFSPTTQFAPGNTTSSRMFLRSRQLNETDATSSAVDPSFGDDSNGGAVDDIPITVAPVYWNDHKQNMDDAIAARGNETCSLSRELQGCVRYAKCQAATGKVKPAPANLGDMCSLAQLKEDPGACESICSDVKCCYTDDSTNCIAKNFDVCLDYAHCQNLRAFEGIIPAANNTLDHNCFYEQLPCLEQCVTAECCSNSNSLCYRNNFIACLTYTPCNNITKTHIHVPKQYSFMDKPPDNLYEVCNPNRTSAKVLGEKTCTEHCVQPEPSCCWAGSAPENCFMKDPLGCLVWEQQCQILLDYKGI